MILLQGDCLEMMKTLPENSVDAIVTDPPYGMDYQSSRMTKEKQHKKIANDKRPFVWFLYEAFRVTKEGGCIASFTDWKNQEAWRLAIEMAGFQIKSQVIWDRNVHGMGDLQSAFGPQHDVIWFATKGPFKFHGSRPKSVISSKRIHGSDLVHPNEKPVDLMQHLIDATCPPNGTVLDPFMGSGSTGIASRNLNRNFIGIELDPEYFNIAQKRINNDTK